MKCAMACAVENGNCMISHHHLSIVIDTYSKQETLHERNPNIPHPLSIWQVPSFPFPIPKKPNPPKSPPLISIRTLTQVVEKATPSVARRILFLKRSFPVCCSSLFPPRPKKKKTRNAARRPHLHIIARRHDTPRGATSMPSAIPIP
jgi:hypothetical protein